MVSDSLSRGEDLLGLWVLILVLMEDGLGLFQRFHLLMKMIHVLILVLMEDGLGPKLYFTCGAVSGLNPCFNGRWSRT